MADDEALARQLQDALFLQVFFVFFTYALYLTTAARIQEMQSDPRFRSEVQGIFNQGTFEASPAPLLL